MEVGDQISKGFVPWLDGFWHFNKVSIYLSIYIKILLAMETSFSLELKE